MAERPAGTRPDRDVGRCHGRDLFGLSGRRRRHAFDPASAVRGDLATRSALQLLHRSRQPLFRDAKGWREAGPASPYPEPAPAKAGVGRALAQLGIEHIPAFSPEARGRSERAFPRFRTACPKSSRSPASRPSLPPTAICARSLCQPTTHALRWRRNSPARPLSRSAISTSIRSCASRSRARSATTTPCCGAGAAAADPGLAVAAAFCPRPGQSAPAPRRHPEHLSRPAMHRPIRAGRTDHCLGRLTPLGGRGRPVDLWITLRVTHNPTGPSSTTEADISCAM